MHFVAIRLQIIWRQKDRDKDGNGMLQYGLEVLLPFGRDSQAIVFNHGIDGPEWYGIKRRPAKSRDIPSHTAQNTLQDIHQLQRGQEVKIDSTVHVIPAFEILP